MRPKAYLACAIGCALILVACATNSGNGDNNGPSAAATPAPPSWVVQKSQRSYPDGFASSSQTFSYDGRGRLEKVCEYNASAVLVVQRNYLYKPGELVEIQTLDPENALQAKTIQEYKNGLLQRERLLNAGDEVHFTSNFRYNEKGHKVYWGISGPNTTTTTSEYRYKGDQLTSIIVTGPLQNILKRYERNYDKTGLLQSEDELDSKGRLLRQTTYQWKDGLLDREETKDDKSLLISAISYHYDDSGRTIKMEIFGQGNNLLEIQTQEWIKLSAAAKGK